MRKWVLIVIGLAVLVLDGWAGTTVTNVTAAQRPGSKLVDIAYDVTSDETNVVTVSVQENSPECSVWVMG
jgi:hypothetical protein